MIDILINIAVGMYCLLIGILIGQRQERQWQRQQQRMNQELEDCQREVNEILAAEFHVSQQAQDCTDKRVN